MKFYTISFTGHRPKGLPWGFDENKESCIVFKKNIRTIIENAIKNNYTYFISGMALGIDMICAEIVIDLRNKYKNVFLECALPCLNQAKLRNEKEQQRYHKILSNANIIHYVSRNEYDKDCMNKRNEYMVKKSDAVIAIWNGKPSGTRNTIMMAKSNNKKVKIINPFDLK